MTSGSERRDARPARRALIGAIAAVGATAAIALATIGPRHAWAQPATAAAGGWDLTRLLDEMSRRKRTRARFVERQFLALLDEPVDASGELSFDAPDKLVKRTISPRPELLSVDGDQVRVERPGLARTMSLQQLPEVAPLIESLRATLNGDRQALETVFDVGLEGRRDAWRMTLRPHARAGASLPRRIVLGGAGNEVRQVEIEQADGDRSVMRILDGR
ncbi:MAG: outer membrane lipoprotein carrier protein LolA [Burkholderiaceae bacterium]